MRASWSQLMLPPSPKAPWRSQYETPRLLRRDRRSANAAVCGNHRARGLAESARQCVNGVAQHPPHIRDGCGLEARSTGNTGQEQSAHRNARGFATENRDGPQTPLNYDSI